MTGHHVETIDTGAVALTDARALAELRCAISDKQDVDAREERFLRPVSYQGPAERRPRILVIRRAGRIAAMAQVSAREIQTSGGRMTVLALAAVCSAPEMRGQGYGKAVIEAAFDLARDGTFPLALFQATQQVRPLYEKLGAQVIDNVTVNSLADDPAALGFWDEVAMIFPADAPWPAGPIDLLGPGW